MNPSALYILLTDPFYIIGLCFGLFLFILIIWNILNFILSAIFFKIGRWIEKIKIKHAETAPRILVEKYERLLLSKFPYYQKLSDKSKIKFLIRLDRFVNSKSFSGREGLVVTDEMKALIGASAIQLTFGLDYYWLNHYENIILFPDIFHNPRSDQYHKGETSPGGRVVLSWKHFLEGYDNAIDKLNLGLHELAHALDLSRLVYDSDQFFMEYYNKWLIVSEDEYENMKHRPSFLRSYGGVNFREFFAVCVEHFFEAPADFKKNLPDIYKHLTVLLRQDPLSTIEKSEEVVMQTVNTLSIDEFHEDPSFSTKLSLWHSLYATGILLLRTFITLLVLFFAFKSHLIVAIIIVLLMVYFFNSLLFTKFELFKEHLLITRPLLFKRKYFFSLENMISVKFNHDNIDTVLITYYNQGEIHKFNALCSISSDDEKKLLGFLRTKKIITNTGEY